MQRCRGEKYPGLFSELKQYRMGVTQTGSDQEQVGTEILELSRDPNLLGLETLETRSRSWALC